MALPTLLDPDRPPRKDGGGEIAGRSDGGRLVFGKARLGEAGIRHGERTETGFTGAISSKVRLVVVMA